VGESLAMLCLWLFLDGATFAFATTPLLLEYGKYHAPWLVAVAGGAASALGSAVQLLLLRWALASHRPWMHRLAPSRDKVESALKDYPAATFLAVLLARATPLPDAPIKLVVAAGGYPLPRYALALFLGALPYYFLLAWLGRVVKIPTWVIVTAVAVIAIGVAVDHLRRRAAARPPA
jgi:uncharacterized membrane protein YdjX (TVP38/TMEM64 family)